MSKKRQREQPSIDTQLVEIYEDLASEIDQVRLRAAIALLATTSINCSPSSEHVEKVLKRLTRGICSSRKAARLGFSVALTEFLAQQWSSGAEHVDGFNWGVSEVIQLLEDQTRVSGSISGQEERDHHLGRLFGSEAIIQSKVLFNSNTEINQWPRIVDLVSGLAIKKLWLREECGWVLMNAVKNLQSQENGIQYAQVLLERLCVTGLAHGPEGVAIWLTASKLFPHIPKPQGIWHNQDPLSQIQELKRAFIAQEHPIKEKSEVVKNSSWNSRPHFAWDVVSGTLLENEKTNPVEVPPQITFEEFWMELVNNTLFAMQSSDERKHGGFLILQRYIEDAPKRFIHVIFSKNYIRCLLNQLSNRETYLHLMASQSFDAICQRISKDPEVATIFIENLLAPNSYENFDNIIRTDVLGKILAQVDFNTIRTIIPLFERWILRPQTQIERTAFTRRRSIVDLLLRAIRPRPKPIQDNSKRTGTGFDSVISEVLVFLTRQSYFQFQGGADNVNAIPEPSISPKTRTMFQTKILSCLTNLSRIGSDVSYHPYDVVSNIHRWEKQNDLISAVFEEDNISSGSIKRAWKTLRKLHSMEQSADPGYKTNLRGLKMLYSIIILQVYNGEADAINILDDLQDCYTRLSKRGKKEQDPGSEILVGILLSLVSRPSLLYRRIAQHVFEAFASSINAEGLHSLIEVLETDEDVSGQTELFESLDEKLAAPVSSDVGMLSMEEDQVSGDDEIGTDRTSEGEDVVSDDSGGDDEELTAFNAKLAEALGTQRGKEGSDASDSDESSGMDDEQMEALEPKLAQVFQERKKITSKKVEKKGAKETIVHFKMRVLDLVEVYIKQQYTNYLATELIIPLLALIRRTKSSHVSTRACALIKDYLLKYRPKDKLNVDDRPATLNRLGALLDQIHELAIKYSSRAYGDTYSKASLLVSKMILANGGAMADLDGRYERTRRISKEDSACKVKPAMFENWANWRHSIVNRPSGNAAA